MKNRVKKGLDALGISAVSDQALNQHILFIDELLRWNKKINLTAVTAAEDVIEKHLLDSLVLIPLLQNKRKIVDIGSGAGLPVIPLAIAMPEKQFCSVDSVRKKTNFQMHIKRMLGLKNLEILCVRIEDADLQDSGWGDVDSVLVRAVGPLEVLLKVALPLLRPGGTLIAMKGPEGEDELRRVEQQWQNHYEFPQVTSYQLPFSGARRSLISAVKKAQDI